ncbi:MAG: tetratricopeptide repeat protein, partial [Merismopedia sp. SIO2A8]|nr:tetratricopeptide repeat protein [Merismopedia sp. SIO2A8]
MNYTVNYTIFFKALTKAYCFALIVSIGIFAPTLPSKSQPIDIEEQLAIPSENRFERVLRNEADSLLQLGGQARKRGNLTEAIAYWLQALEIYEEIGDFEALNLTYDYLGLSYARIRDYEKAEDALRRRLGMARSLRDLQGQIYGLNNLGTVLLQRGDFEAAQKTFTEALEITRSVRNRQGEGLTLSNLGLAAFHMGKYAEAIEYYEAALVLRPRSENAQGSVNTRNNMGDAYRAVNNPRKALGYYRTAL